MDYINTLRQNCLQMSERSTWYKTGPSLNLERLLLHKGQSTGYRDWPCLGRRLCPAVTPIGRTRRRAVAYGNRSVLFCIRYLEKTHHSQVFGSWREKTGLWPWLGDTGNPLGRVTQTRVPERQIHSIELSLCAQHTLTGLWFPPFYHV